MAEDRVAFIIAGVQKGGTTALFDYLGEAPDLSLSRVKEVHFFDDETQDWARPDYGAYHANFAAFDGRRRAAQGRHDDRQRLEPHRHGRWHALRAGGRQHVH